MSNQNDFFNTCSDRFANNVFDQGTIDNRQHINTLFNGREGLTLNLERHTRITADAVFGALCAKNVSPTPQVELVSKEWEVRQIDMYTLVDISVSPDDPHFYGDLKVHINWL